MDDQKAQSGRTLSKAEKERSEIFAKVTLDLESRGYSKKDLTVSTVKANVLGTLAGVIVASPIAAVFLITGGIQTFSDSPVALMIMFPAFVLSIVVHELLHGTGWALFAKNGFKNIAFGVVWSALMPYCTCKVPLRKGPYILGLVLPLIILGIIPGILACVFGSYALLIYGLLMTVCAGGDLLVLFLIIRSHLKGDVLFLDHPTDVGLVGFVKES